MITFQGDSGVTPDLGTFRVEAKCFGPRALSNTNPGSLKPDSRDPETETGNLETEKRVRRIHGTLEKGVQIMPRSLVAPDKQGPADFLCSWMYGDLSSILVQ